MKDSQNTRTTIGMSLLELLIVLAIISIIASIGYPNYIKFKLETRRAEAKSTLTDIQSNIQRYLIATNTAAASLTTTNLSALYTLPLTTANGYYSVNVTITSPTYTITATAIGTQASDTNCATMTMDSTSVTSSKNSSNQSSIGCW